MLCSHIHLIIPYLHAVCSVQVSKDLHNLLEGLDMDRPSSISPASATASILSSQCLQDLKRTHARIGEEIDFMVPKYL